ncbi:MAG: hypothetical protein HeimC2_41040 [Candidatus Heimdallarchaeota archaeon LC_2]|nr:MAG: hypothetical protein HeimC2_41040 [Candidatus Heimdallarchaeota archaeon LC_2]
MDYVPIISDIDIHYGVHDKKKLFTSDNPRETSLKVSLEYEKRFQKENPNFIHIPRTQVMCIDLLQDAVNFVHPLVDSIKMLFGEFPSYDHVASENIKEIDINNLAELKPYLDMLPESWIDKVGMDYWSSLRRLTWKVSPTPVRILSQLLPNPLNIWTWNRSKIKQELENQNLNNIANMYESYYMNGWKLFESNITSTEYFQNCLLTGSKVLELSYDWYIQNITNNRK